MRKIVLRSQAAQFLVRLLHNLTTIVFKLCCKQWQSAFGSRVRPANTVNIKTPCVFTHKTGHGHLVLHISSLQWYLPVQCKDLCAKEGRPQITAPEH